MLPPPNKRLRAFTLVELSIVIVIIGLIVAGVTAGRSVVKASQLRSVLTDINKMKISVNAFKLQYNGLPGDLKNAYDYWGVAKGCTNQFVESNIAGCNGNGDGNWDTTGGFWTHETHRIWQHLNWAGLWPGNFDNAVIGGGGGAVVNRDVPAGPMNTAYQSEYTPLGVNHIRFIGAVSNVSGNYASITPLDAENLDKKADDGIATTGIARAWVGTDSGGNWYADALCSVGTAYTVSQTAKTCRVFFIIK